MTSDVALPIDVGQQPAEKQENVKVLRRRSCSFINLHQLRRSRLVLNQETSPSNPYIEPRQTIIV